MLEFLEARKVALLTFEVEQTNTMQPYLCNRIDYIPISLCYGKQLSREIDIDKCILSGQINQ